MADNQVSVTEGAGKDIASLTSGGKDYGIALTYLNVSDTPTPLDLGAGNVGSATPRLTLAANDPAVTALGAIQTAIEALDNAVDGNEFQVDVITSALPTGAATSGNQSTIIGYIDGIESALATLVGAVDGTEIQVDVLTSALPAGAATSANQSTANSSLADIETNTDFGAVVGGGVEATALRVTLANDSTGVVSIDDNGGSLTVDGTVGATQSGAWNIADITGTVSLPTGAATAANQATANTALAAIQSALETIDNIVSGSEAQVDVVSSALPDGAATAANQSTLVGHVDGIEGLLTTIAGAVDGAEVQVDVVSLPLPSGAATAANQSTANATLSAIQAAVETIDNIVSGSEAQVDVVGPLPAGDNNIGNVDIASSIPAGSNVIGQTTGAAETCSATITRPANTTAYAAGDVWADSTSAPTTGGATLSGAARASGGSGVITDIVIGSSVADSDLEGEIWIFDQAVTAVNDNAAWTISDSEQQTLVAVVPFNLAGGKSASNNQTQHLQGLGIGFTCVGSDDLRFIPVVRSAYTPTSGETLFVRAKTVQLN